MKHEAVLKVNKMGKVSHNVAMIAKVLLIIGLICSIIGAVVCAVFPDKLLQLQINGGAEIGVDVSTLGVHMSEEEKEEILKGYEDGKMEGSVSVNQQEYLFEQMEVDGDVIKVQASAKSMVFGMRDLMFCMIWVAIIVASTLVLAFFIDNLCKAFRDCESPFEANVIQKMTHFAYALIPWSVISSCFSIILENWFSNERTFMIGIDLGMLVVVLVLFALIYVFRYGAMLQQESDETL